LEQVELGHFVPSSFVASSLDAFASGAYASWEGVDLEVQVVLQVVDLETFET